MHIVNKNIAKYLSKTRQFKKYTSIYYNVYTYIVLNLTMSHSNEFVTTAPLYRLYYNNTKLDFKDINAIKHNARLT